MLEAPDGTQLRIRILYNTGATDGILDWKLAKFFHHMQKGKNDSKGVNSTKPYATHVGELKIMRFDGTHILVKAMKGEMSSPAFTIKKKSIDIPPHLVHWLAGPDLLPTNIIGDVRITHPVEDYQVQLLLGLFMPREMDSCADEGGQLILFQSLILAHVLPTGSRRTGRKSSMKYEGRQRSYRIIEDGSEFNLRRS